MSDDETVQTQLDVGETRKPIAIKHERRVTTGDLAALAMCAHRYDPDDVMGWYTHDVGDVIRQWITSNVGSVIARLSPHCEYTRGECPPLHPSDGLFVGEVDTGPTQTTLVTDGGQVEDGAEREELCCWVVRYDGDKHDHERERTLGRYPRAQEDNPWSEVLIAGWSA